MDGRVDRAQDGVATARSIVVSEAKTPNSPTEDSGWWHADASKWEFGKPGIFQHGNLFPDWLKRERFFENDLDVSKEEEASQDVSSRFASPFIVTESQKTHMGAGCPTQPLKGMPYTVTEITTRLYLHVCLIVMFVYVLREYCMPILAECSQQQLFLATPGLMVCTSAHSDRIVAACGAVSELHSLDLVSPTPLAGRTVSSTVRCVPHIQLSKHQPI